MTNLTEAMITALKHMQQNNVISLRKGDDYIVIGYNEDCKQVSGARLGKLMTEGWEEVIF